MRQDWAFHAIQRAISTYRANLHIAVALRPTMPHSTVSLVPLGEGLVEQSGSLQFLVCQQSWRLKVLWPPLKSFESWRFERLPFIRGTIPSKSRGKRPALCVYVETWLTVVGMFSQTFSDITQYISLPAV